MRTYRELLSAIKGRPGMYLGKRSIIRLKAFLDGWSFARGHEIPDSDFLEGLHAWVATKYRVTSSHGWDSIILFFEEDERAAFERFWELLDQFLVSKGRLSLGEST